MKKVKKGSKGKSAKAVKTVKKGNKTVTKMAKKEKGKKKWNFKSTFEFFARPRAGRKNGKHKFANGMLVRFKGIKAVIINHVKGGTVARILLSKPYEKRTRFDVPEKSLRAISA